MRRLRRRFRRPGFRRIDRQCQHAVGKARLQAVAGSGLRHRPDQRGFDLPWTTDVEATIREIDRESKEGAAKPSHSYSLADYGLSDDQVLAAFDR